MIDDLVKIGEWKNSFREIQITKHIWLKWERIVELLADTNLATLTMITDFYKSNKHAIRDLRVFVQDTFKFLHSVNIKNCSWVIKKKKIDL